MQLLVSLLASLAIIPVIAFGTSIHSSALWSLLCVALIVGSLYIMFSSGESNDVRV
jgi:hypothetical protein